MTRLACLLLGHRYEWPPHARPLMWDDFDLECVRGCGTRRVKRCHEDAHFENHHPEDELDGRVKVGLFE